ncbi:MAG: protein-disulfide reductase DsbD family protein [Candidatus Binatia bacterium]|nr:protein-disulfide reductase DsbD family protein [Candidatus Binatia bacterium]
MIDGSIEEPILRRRQSEFGILNTFIDEADGLFSGIPYPGTYVLDEDGIVREKFFPRHLANRESADTVLESSLGRVLMGDDDPSANGGDDDVKITAFFHGGPLKSGPLRRLVVRFELRDGLHIYGEPVPDGMVATQVTVEGPEGLVVQAAILPPTEPLRLDALDVDLQVWNGTVDIPIPRWANSKLVCLMRPVEPNVVTLGVTVRYQACDDNTCLTPRTEKLQVAVPLAPHVVPRFLGDTGPQAASMDSEKHLEDMMERSQH